MFPVAGSSWVGDPIDVGAGAGCDPLLRMGKLVSPYAYRLLGVVAIADSYDFGVIGVGVVGVSVDLASVVVSGRKTLMCRRARVMSPCLRRSLVCCISNLGRSGSMGSLRE